MAISDRIAVMKQGCIEQLGHPTEIYDDPHSRFVAEFIGEMNFVEQNGQTLAVRPEDVALQPAAGQGMARVESIMPLGHYTQIVLQGADSTRLKVFVPREQAAQYTLGQGADYTFLRQKVLESA